MNLIKKIIKNIKKNKLVLCSIIGIVVLFVYLNKSFFYHLKLNNNLVLGYWDCHVL